MTAKAKKDQESRTPIDAREAWRAAGTRAMTATVTEKVRGAGRDGTRTRPLNRVDLLTFVALTVELGEFDKVEGKVALSQIYSLVPANPRDVRRALKNLHDAGVVYKTDGKPGYGDKEATAATYSVVVPDAGTGVQDPAMTGVQDPRVSGVPGARDGGTGREERGSQYPTSEVPSEASSDVPLTRAEMVTIGKRLVRNFYNKVPGVISEVVTDLGADGVSAALRDLDAAGERFPGQIGLEAAIRDRATPAPTRPHALYQRPKCDTCNGSKMTYDEHANVARPCPECNAPQAVAG